MDEDQADNSSVTTEEQTSAMDEDWADNSSVTTDEESPTPPSKKNIHARRWTLVSKGDNSFVIEGGRKPKTINMPPRSEMFEDQKHLAEADFVLERLYLSRSPGRNGHVSTGISLSGYISRSLETMTDEFHHYQNLWLKSDAYTSLRSTILSLKRSQSNHVPIDNIVCLALGSPQNTLEVCRAASLTQLAVLMTIIEDLDLDPFTTPGKFIAQDPLFTPLDAEFLTSLGFLVLPDPEGFLAITPTTLVFSIAGYLAMDWVISQGPWPAALICGDVEAFMRSVEESKRTEKRGIKIVCPTKVEQGEILGMLGGCEVVSLVGEGGVEGWEGIERQRVYWRRKGGEK